MSATRGQWCPGGLAAIDGFPKKVRCPVCNRRLTPKKIFHHAGMLHDLAPEKVVVPKHKAKK